MARRKQAPKAGQSHMLEQSCMVGVLNPIHEPLSPKEWEEQQAKVREQALAQIGARLATIRDNFALIFDQVSDEVHSAMRANGFWDGERNFGEGVALVHSELSELLEANRKDIGADSHIPDYSGEEAEAADTVIRMLDLSGNRGWRLGHAIIDKMLFNLTRPYKHGKKY